MININLVNDAVNTSCFEIIDTKEYPLLFLGYIIKTEYDNKRINLVDKYNPISFLHFSKDKKSAVALKGVKLTPNHQIKELYRGIAAQEKLAMNLVVYENLLNQYNFACKETYALFSPGMYPIDFNNLKTICEDSFNTDKKIFQHLLGIDEKVFDFQKFSSLKLFILTM